MEDNTKMRRMRKVSSWISDTAKSVNNEEEVLAGKKIVLKVLRYMESNNMTQKELAEKLGVSPQYINKFLHGQECDIKVSTAIRYGRILNTKLIEIPEDDFAPSVTKVLYTINNYVVTAHEQGRYAYNRECVRTFNYN